MYNKTRRRGQFLFDSGRGPLLFVITGSNGTYDSPYDWIYFDMDRDGTFNPKVEGYQISERYVNIGELTYEFAVDRYGRTVTLTPLAEKRPRAPSFWRAIRRLSSTLSTFRASAGDSWITGQGRIARLLGDLVRAVRGFGARASRGLRKVSHQGLRDYRDRCP